MQPHVLNVLQVALCIFVMCACVFNIVCEHKRSKQLDKIYEDMRKRCLEDVNDDK